ncbi:MAG: hypothetical protein JRF56_04360 [Deltaproteobacteria bacterium]|nr:hypothetical protein [Deltaproteobacteria bacterium]
MRNVRRRSQLPPPFPPTARTAFTRAGFAEVYASFMALFLRHRRLEYCESVEVEIYR